MSDAGRDIAALIEQVARLPGLGPRSARRLVLHLLRRRGQTMLPLGQALETGGIAGRRCCHLDFGQALRDLWEAGAGADWTNRDVNRVGELLHKGRLLEPDTFYIAQRIINAFLDRRKVGPEAWVILNGLPRHTSQAEAVDALFAIRYVIVLDCTPAVVAARIRLDSGGDRTGRNDDDKAAISRKLKIFRDRTLPLVNHYEIRGVSVVRVPVQVNTRSGEMAAIVNDAISR